MPKHVRHIWAKANQYVKVHRYKPKKQPPALSDIGITANDIMTIAIALTVLALLSRLLGC